jgi:hypothetical protein
MALSMYQASVPVFVKMLGNLRAMLAKAAAHAGAKKIEESAFLDARLSPDMFPFTSQVQIATDFAKGTAARLAGVEPPAYDDTEKSFAQLIERIDRAVAYLKTIDAGAIDGSEERPITRPIRGEPKTFSGLSYLLFFALPNFYFHTAIAYALLRHNGVDVGKNDFIGSLDTL